METTEKEFLIDLDAILRNKLGKKARFIPRFIVSWFKKILHQDDLNRFLQTDAKGQMGVGFLDGAVKFLHLDLHAQTKINGVVTPGLDAIPTNEDGRYYTIVSNHPLGGPDGVMLGSVVCHHFNNKMVYLVREDLLAFRGLAPLSVPINKFGGQSRNFPAKVNAAFQSDNNVVMFPAGICSRLQDDGTIKDEPWKKTFINKTVEYKRDVIPVHFSGKNSDKFYKIARRCKKLGIKFNFAQLYLSDEMFRNAGKSFTITFGEPIPWQTFDKSKTATEWAQWVKNKVYELE